MSILYRKDYRFDAFECPLPYDVPIDEWKELMSKDKSLKCILISSVPLFDQTKEIPSFDEYQRLVLNRTLDYAKVLNVKKIHLYMADTNDDADR